MDLLIGRGFRHDFYNKSDDYVIMAFMLSVNFFKLSRRRG